MNEQARQCPACCPAHLLDPRPASAVLLNMCTAVMFIVTTCLALSWPLASSAATPLHAILFFGALAHALTNIDQTRRHVRHACMPCHRKALLPLYLLTILSFGTFEFDVDNLDTRAGKQITHCNVAPFYQKMAPTIVA